MQFPGDDGALVHQRHLLLLLDAPLQVDRRGQLVGEGVEQPAGAGAERRGAGVPHLQGAEQGLADAHRQHQALRPLALGELQGLGVDQAGVAVVVAAVGRPARRVGGEDRHLALVVGIVQRQADGADAEQRLEAAQHGRGAGAEVVAPAVELTAAVVEDLHRLVAARQLLLLARDPRLELRVALAELRGHGVQGVAEQRQLVAAREPGAMAEVAASRLPGQHHQLVQRAHQVVADVVEGDRHHHRGQHQEEDLQGAEQADLGLAVLLEPGDHLVDVAHQAVEGLAWRRVSTSSPPPAMARTTWGARVSSQRAWSCRYCSRRGWSPASGSAAVSRGLASRSWKRSLSAWTRSRCAGAGSRS